VEAVVTEQQAAVLAGNELGRIGKRGNAFAVPFGPRPGRERRGLVEEGTRAAITAAPRSAS
jgi:hypothetical protein